MPQATPSTPSQMLLNKSSFPDNTLNNGDTVTSADGAVTATFSNVVSFDGMMAGGVADVEGLFLGEFGNEIDQFDITFNVDTRITSYTIGSTTTFGSGYLFRLSGAGAFQTSWTFILNSRFDKFGNSSLDPVPSIDLSSPLKTEIDCGTFASFTFLLLQISFHVPSITCAFSSRIGN